jgi:predicted DNA binding CopG/RHH family protein
MKTKKSSKIYNEIPLDDYEKELKDFLDKGEYRFSENLEETKKMWKDAAKNFKELQSSKSVTLRVNKGDLIKIKARAKRNNIAYQTLIGLLIRKYVRGETNINI